MAASGWLGIALRPYKQRSNRRTRTRRIREGALWRVKLEGNDGDLHRELSAGGKGRSAERIIAEIPQEYVLSRRKLLGIVGARDRERTRDGLPDSRSNYRAMNLHTPVDVRLTGFAFYDADHYIANWRHAKPGRCRFTPEQVQKRGRAHGTCAVGTLWELHPVWEVAAVYQR